GGPPAQRHGNRAHGGGDADARNAGRHAGRRGVARSGVGAVGNRGRGDGGRSGTRDSIGDSQVTCPPRTQGGPLFKSITQSTKITATSPALVTQYLQIACSVKIST